MPHDATSAEDWMSGCLYRTEVVHQRHHPRRHRLRYRLTYLRVDVDALPALDARLKWFGYNRRAPFAVFDADHGTLDGDESIRTWLDRVVAAEGFLVDGRRYEMVCLPRVLGYAFNPISVVYSFAGDGQCDAVIYEVHNTFGERHAYVVPVTGRAPRGCEKTFYVSPFCHVRGRYTFRTRPPGDSMGLAITYRDTPADADETVVLTAAMTGRRLPLTDRRLARELALAPAAGVKVIAAIHFEALKLWLKRIPTTLSEKPRRPDRARGETPRTQQRHL